MDLPLHRLAPATGEELRLTGSRMSVGLAGAFAYDPVSGSSVPVRLSAVLASPDDWTEVPLGTVGDGARSTAMPCSAGCRLVVHPPGT